MIRSCKGKELDLEIKRRLKREVNSGKYEEGRKVGWKEKLSLGIRKWHGRIGVCRSLEVILGQQAGYVPKHLCQKVRLETCEDGERSWLKKVWMRLHIAYGTNNWRQSGLEKKWKKERLELNMCRHGKYMQASHLCRREASWSCTIHFNTNNQF